jgi:phosphoglycolate phosphatase
MRGLGVLWGYGTRDELETAGADQLVDSPADLARTVLSMINGKESPGLGHHIQASSLTSAPGT